MSEYYNGELGVIEVNGEPFPSLKSTFPLFFKKKIPNIFIAGCYRRSIPPLIERLFFFDRL